VSKRRKFLLAAAALAGLLLTVAVGVGTWLTYSESGLARAIALLESLDSIQLTVQGGRGRLAGPLHVDSIELRAGRVGLRAQGVDIDGNLVALVFGHLHIGRLAVESLDLVIGPAVAPPSDEPPHFMPGWLSIGVGRASAGLISIRLPNSTELRYRDVTLSGSVTHSRIELDEVAADAGLWSAHGAVSLVARDPLRLSGNLAWSVPGKPALAGTLRAKGDLARLDIDAAIRDPVAASVNATLEDLATGLHWKARASSEAIDLSPWMAEPPVGPLAGHVEASGDLRIFELAGHFDGPGLTSDGLDLEATLVLDGKELLLEPLLVATPDRRLTIENRGRIAVGDERSLELRSAWAGVAWPLAGAPVVSSRQGTLELRGWDRLGFAADAVVTLPDLPDVAVVASGQADRMGIVVLQSRLDARAGTAEAEGFFGFGTGHPWRLDANVRDLDLSAFREGLDSQLSFHAAGSGQGTGQDAAWAAHIGSIEGVARGQKLSGAGFLRHQLGHYDIERFAFRLGPARIEVNGHVGGETALTASFEAPDLSGFLPELGGSLQAKLEARSVGAPAADGSNLRVDLAVRGRDLRYGEQRAAVLSADADIDLSDRESSWIRLRAAGMQAGGQDIASTRISLDGRAREHEVDFRVGAGEKAVSLVGEGRFDEGVYRLTATRIESEAPALHPYSLEAPMLVVIGADAAQLEETCFVHAPRRICLRADWRRDAGWSATLATHAFPLEALRVDLPRSPGYRGLLDLDVAAAGKVDMPWTATASATLREAWLEYVTPSGRQERVSLGVAHLSLESLPERHRLAAAIDDTTAMQLQAEATLERSEGVPLGESPLSGSLQFSTKRLGLLPLLVPDIDKAEGSLQARLKVSGIAAAPVLGGTMELEGGLFEFYQTNLRLREVGARVDLLDEGLRLQSRGKAGDGTFAANGQFAWRERQLHGQLTLKGDNLLLADVPEVRIEASPDLAFDFDGAEIGVRGSVTVPKARIEPRQLIGAVTASADERIVGIGEEQDDDTGYRVTSDMRLNLGKDVRLDAFGLKGRLEGSVVLQSRPDEVTTASGEFEIMDGKYRAYSKELDVDTGRLLFAGGPVSDPGIDLRASKKVPGYEVGVIARGRLRKPELSLFSDPSMPQSQIASLLLVGRRLDNLDSSSRQNLGGSTSDMAAEGGALLAGQLGRYIGIDEISLESQTTTGTDATPGKESSLVIGKFLSPRFYISYGISLSNAINTFKLRYTIGDRWVISGEAGQEASADIEYTIDR